MAAALSAGRAGGTITITSLYDGPYLKLELYRRRRDQQVGSTTSSWTYLGKSKAIGSELDLLLSDFYC
jgi:hypothetical protein